jgi:hypothetical protein
VSATRPQTRRSSSAIERTMERMRAPRSPSTTGASQRSVGRVAVL